MKLYTILENKANASCVCICCTCAKVGTVYSVCSIIIGLCQLTTPKKLRKKMTTPYLSSIRSTVPLSVKNVPGR
jgi:hypothetical protein